MSRDDRGQALVVVVALLGFAALVVLSLTEADDRIVARVRAERAAEAAAEAGGAVVADRLVLLAAAGGGQRPRADVLGQALADPDLPGLATAAAADVLARLGASCDPVTLERRVDEISLKVRIRREGVEAIARVGVRAP